MLKDKTVVLGVTGSIAAYKAAEIVSLLIKEGAVVKVVMTEAATRLIGEMTLQTLSRQPVHTRMFEAPDTWEIDHIALAKAADYFLVAPASANIIGKMAGGIADDMLSTTIMATEAVKVIAPAMNSKMYLNPAVQRNMEQLKAWGCHFIDPATGMLACGDEGIGKLASPAEIVRFLKQLESRGKSLEGKKVLVTAGPTLEAIDPVRYISNHSSGKMGYAIAEAAAARGAQVTLVSGPVHLTPPSGMRFIPVESALEMNEAVMENSSNADLIIKSAAVSDYRPKSKQSQKIKKKEGVFSIELERNPDILANLGEKKKSGQVLIGFAAETQELIENAQSKLLKKRLDMIVANDVSRKDAGFKSDMNQAILIKRDGTRVDLDRMSKRELSERILDEAEALLRSSPSGEGLQKA